MSFGRGALVIAAAIALAACGGGGGGGGGSTAGGSTGGGATGGGGTGSGGTGGGGGSGSAGGDGFFVGVDHTTVTFDYVQGANPGEQIVTATWGGNGPFSFYMATIVQGPGLDPELLLSDAGGKATTSFRPLPGLAVGTYEGNVQFLACPDSPCTQLIGGSPIRVDYTINVHVPLYSGPPAILMNYVRWSSGAPPTATLSVSADAGAWTAAANQPWLVLSQTSGSGAATVTVGLNPAALTFAGNLNASISLTGRGVTQTSTVTLNVTEPTIQLPTVMLSATNGAPITTQSTAFVYLQGAGSASLPMQVESTVSWLTIVSAPASVSGSSPATISLTLDPLALPLGSGVHSGTLRFRFGTAFDSLTRDVFASFELHKAVLTATPASIVLGGSAGRTFDGVPVSISLDTGGNSYPWTADADASWLSVDDTSGTVNSSGTQLLVTPDRLEATPGTATSSLSFSVSVNGDVVTLEVPVSFNLDAHRLIAADNGVALVDVPGTVWDVPGQAIEIRDNLGLDTPWTAVADQPWLHVTAAGESGDDLVLSADSTALAADQLYLATVTVSSTDSTVVEPERIRVGFWVGSAVPATPKTFLGLYIMSAVADPIRPYVYEFESGATSLRVFNAYTGTELPRITGLPGGIADLRDMFTSSDGSRLYISNLRDHSLIPVDLDTGAIGTPIVSPQQQSIAIDHFKYARPNGVGVLLNNIGDVFLESSGAFLGTGFIAYFGVSGDGLYAFFGNARYTLDFTAVGGGVFSKTESGSIANFGTVDDPKESNADGSRVYSMINASLINGAQNSIVAANGLTFDGPVSTGLIYRNMLVAEDRRLLVIARDSAGGAEQLHVLETDGSQVQPPHYIGGVTSSRGILSVTGDSRFGVVVSLTPDWAVQVVPIQP